MDVCDGPGIGAKPVVRNDVGKRHTSQRRGEPEAAAVNGRLVPAVVPIADVGGNDGRLRPFDTIGGTNLGVEAEGQVDALAPERMRGRIDKRVPGGNAGFPTEDGPWEWLAADNLSLNIDPVNNRVCR